MPEPYRRLAAIVAIDVAGYSRLMGEDEEGTLARMKAHRAVTDPIVTKHGGRIVGEAGDGLLLEFPSVVEAVSFAVEIQSVMADRNALLSIDDKMLYRIGINLGDVLVDGDNIFGDGVNIAARLEAIANPGGICVSGTVRDNVHAKLEVVFNDLGKQQVKNIAEAVQVYGIETLPKTDSGTGAASPRKRHFPMKLAGGVVTVLLLAVIGAVLAWQKPWQPSFKPALALPDKPSIAVLPFNNMSGDSNQEYFADGMTEDLITDLSKIPGLFVIARNSVFTYKGKPIKVQQVAEELGVRYVLEGSVRRVGEQVRINTQLIDATTGHHLWADRYDGSLADVFSLQDKVTAKIVAELSSELGHQPAPVSKKVIPQTNAATSSSAGRAITMDSNEPDGYLKLAGQLTFLGEPTAAVPLVERAMRLDPKNIERYAFALGLAQLGMDQPAAAAKTLAQAVEKDAKNVHIWFLLAAAYGLVGDQTNAAAALTQLQSIKAELGIPENFFSIRQLSDWGFKQPEDINRIATGLRKAGLTE